MNNKAHILISILLLINGAVFASAPCPGYANTATGAPDACGAQLYDLQVLNNGCNADVIFDVIGNYGSAWANEITWTVTSVLTGNVVASGGPGTNGTGFTVSVSLDPSVEGNVFNLEIFDTFGDGFNGVGGFIQVEDQSGNIVAGPIDNFGPFTNQVFAVNLDISSATITITTPSGPVVSSIGNCADFNVQLTLDNTFFCTPVNINLPWTIVCDQTGLAISSGTLSVTVYPQIATQASDVVTITWNAGTCQWVVSPQNDCDLLDIGSVFLISPDPAAWPANTCVGGSQDFTIDYVGVAAGPVCCLTGGPLVPIVYNTTANISDPVVQTSPYGGMNNSANTTIAPNGSGGIASTFSLTVSVSGYCYPDPISSFTDDRWFVAIWIDGVQVVLIGPLNGTTFNITIDETDLAAVGITYDETSVIEIYVLPNLLSAPLVLPTYFTTYVPGGNCGAMGDGDWTISTYDVTLDVEFVEQIAGPAVCSFDVPSPYTCCVITLPTASNPTPINVQCGVPAADVTVVTDEASPCNPVVSFIGDVSDGNTCPEVITRTYRVTDDCSNQITVTQTITVDDDTDPTASNPAPVAVQCIGDVPAADVAVVTDEADNCSVPVVAFVSNVSDGNTCPEVITRTYSVTDDCGNQIAVTQTITVNDNTDPVFAGAPADVTVECVGDVPAMTNLGWTDNCDGSGSVAGSDGALSGGSCGGTITRTWSYSDACGNTGTATQTITVDDNTAPTFAAAPVDVTVECVGDVPAMTNLDWTDNCDGSGSVAGSDGALSGGSCGGTITRTWTYTDACGNTGTATQTITVDDNTDPTATAPSAVTVECFGDVPVSDVTLIIDEADNCTVAPAVTFVGDVSDGNTCPEVITRTYSVTDDCGNSLDLTQTITIQPALLVAVIAPPGLLNCTTNTLVLDGSGSTLGACATYSWTTVGGNITSVTNTATIDIDAPGDYTLTISQEGCTAQTTVSVTEDITAPTALDQSPTICEGVIGSGSAAGIDLTGNNASINGGGGITYSWYTDAGATVAVVVPTSYTVNNGDVFYVVVADGSCTDTAMVTYTVTSIITVSDPSPSLCEDASGSAQVGGYDLTGLNNAVFAGGGGTVYTWYMPDMVTAVVTPTSVTITDGAQYWIDVLDGNCGNKIMVNFTVNPQPTALDQAPTLCEDVLGSGSAAGIDLTGNNASINGGGGGITYSWYTDAGATVAVVGPTSYTVNNGDVFYVVVADGSCTDTAMVIYTVTSTVTVSDPSPSLCEDVPGSAQVVGYDLTGLNNAVFAGGGGTVYTWYMSDMVTVVGIPTSVTITDGAQYWIDVFDGNCGNAIMVNFTVNALPTADITGGGPICAGDPIPDIIITLTGTQPWAITYDVSGTLITVTGIMTSPYTITGGADGTYTVTVVSDANCSGTSMTGLATITTNPMPMAMIGTDATVCAGSPDITITLTGVNGMAPYTFAYTVDGGAIQAVVSDFSGVATLTQSAALAGTFVYELVSVSDASVTACSQAQAGTATVIVNPLPVYLLTPTDPTVCNASDGSILIGGLTAGGTYDVTYDDGITAPITLSGQVATGGEIIIVSLGAGSYDVTLSVTATGCTGVPLQTTLFNPGAPIIDPIAPYTSCAVNYVLPVITGTNLSGSETYYDLPGGPLGGGSVYAAGTVISSSITLYIYDEIGVCSSQEAVIITINSLPVLTATNGGPYCSGAATMGVDETGGSATTWFWTSDGSATFSPNATAQNPDLTGVVDGETFTVTGTDGNGCVNTAQTTLVINPLPTVTATNTGPLCADAVSFTIDETGGTATSWSWTSDGSATFSPNATAQNPDLTGVVDGETFTVTGTDGNGCVNTSQTTLVINALPTVTATNGGPYCSGDAMSVDETGGAAGTWSWTSDGSATFSPNATAQNPDVTGVVDGETFTVTGTDANGCVDSSQTTITINPEPDADFEVSGGSCESAEFTARGIEGVVPILTWYWAFGDGNFSSDPDSATHVYTSAGIYDITLIVTSDSGCVDTVFKPSAVNAYVSPNADFVMMQSGITLDPNVTTILSPSIDFVNVSSSNVDSVIWDFGDEESGAENTSNDLNPVHVFSDTGTYTITLTVYTPEGCEDIIVQELVVEGEYILFAPNAFTPDGDGFNDFFLPKGVGITGEDFDLMIYNRWGDLIRDVSGVFSDDVTAGWDGKANNGNGIVQMDVYVWVIYTRDANGGKHQYVGHVTLLR